MKLWFHPRNAKGKKSGQREDERRRERKEKKNKKGEKTKATFYGTHAAHFTSWVQLSLYIYVDLYHAHNPLYTCQYHNTTCLCHALFLCPSFVLGTTAPFNSRVASLLPQPSYKHAPKVFSVYFLEAHCHDLICIEDLSTSWHYSQIMLLWFQEMSMFSTGLFCHLCLPKTCQSIWTS